MTTTICIDGFNIALAQGSGIATYGRNLLSSLQRLDFETQVLFGPARKLGSDPVLNEVLLADATEATPSVNKRARFISTATSGMGRTVRPVRASGEVIWPSRSGGKPAADTFWAAQNLFYYAHRAFQAYGSITPVRFGEGPAPDIMQWTATLPMKARTSLNLYTIHDLIPLRLPHSTMENKQRYSALVKEIASTADHIVAVSENTRQDVIRLLGVEEDRVTNTYQAVEVPAALANRPEDDVRLELEGIFNLGWKDYFLYFGAIEPKKNLGRIVESYLASGSEKPLVIVGGRAWLEGPELSLLEQVQRDGGPGAQKLRRYEYMPYSMLVSLIRGARSVLFPSLYEGFGLPVLEAMQLKTAVLTSTAGSLPEVADDAALLVDPYDTQAITRGIQALDADDGLVDGLVDRGMIRAKAFSVAAYEQRLADLYARIL